MKISSARLTHIRRVGLAIGLLSGGGPLGLARAAVPGAPAPVELSSGWQLQDAARIPEGGNTLSQVSFTPAGWYRATVPGTVLTTLVDNGVYPEPLFGENNRPDRIPEGLCRTSYWYRVRFTVPDSFAKRRIWLNFEGINYRAEVWVDGARAGETKGAFARGRFDVTQWVRPGLPAAVAVHVFPPPHPGTPAEQTVAAGTGLNGGISAADGPTFLCTLGWDWIPGIRDRDTGIWQKAFLSATGPVLVQDPYVVSDLPLPRTDSADLTVEATLHNTAASRQKGRLVGECGPIAFQYSVTLQSNESRVVRLTPEAIPQLRLANPRLWWPNGFGPQNLYTMNLRFETDGGVSDSTQVVFGVRKVTYQVPDSENLTISVNGVRVMAKGGNWGMDEAMKRIPRARLEAQVRMHQIANYTIIRNWVGQSTSEDFYELCDKYGILLWDEFFQPNPSDGPNPEDTALYMANVREKILRFRSHPSIAVWCARNEGFSPPEIDSAAQRLMAELDPSRLYQRSSTEGRGVHSGGPYRYRFPREYYDFKEAFKTELGSVSVPTLEAVHAMMPRKDWETVNDDWAEHDLCNGAQAGGRYPGVIAARFGAIINLPDFVRKAQLANFEAWRAMYEGRNAKLFHPCTGVIAWMSNPSQPSFVWQLYSHDLEPNASLFAVRKACEPVHIQMNENDWHVMVINNLPSALESARAVVSVYNLDGSLQLTREMPCSAPPSIATDLGAIDWPPTLSRVHFIKLRLMGADGILISDNFYWRALPQDQDDFQELNRLPGVVLDAAVVRRDADGKCLLDVTLDNKSGFVAITAHLQLRRKGTDERVLPVYYSDNYVSLLPGESKVISIEASQADLNGDVPRIVVDGWNTSVAYRFFPEDGGAEIDTNTDAIVSPTAPRIFTVVPAPARGR